MSLKHGLLGLLTLRKASGYDLSKLFEESLNYFWVANQSQIYRELDKMEQVGWVTSTKVEQSARPNKRVYGITKLGNDELITWLKHPGVEQLMVVRSPLVMKLFFSAKVDRHDVIALLINYRTECEKILAQLNEELSALAPVNNADNKPQYWRYTTDYCIGYYKFLIDWSSTTIDSLLQLTQN